jgi:two-component system sensor kinase FixL
VCTAYIGFKAVIRAHELQRRAKSSDDMQKGRKMKVKPRRQALATSRMYPFLAAAFAVAIFVVDTATTLDIAIAVLYVVVVLLSANFLARRGVLMVASGCAALTVASFLLSHGLTVGTPLVRCLVSLSAIGATTFLALRNQSANLALRGQARLLDLTHDSIFVRDMNDVTTYWNRGAEHLYGWRTDEAVGTIFYQLMKTVFPAPLEDIKAELIRTGRWEGDVLHTRRDGTRITVSSRWSLQRDERGRPVAIMGTSNDITERNRAQEALQRAQAELAHVARVVTLGELAASIAHEVKQPLAGIVTNGSACLRWLARLPPDLDEVRRSVESMIGDAMRANEVVSGLRALSRKTDPVRALLDLDEVVGEVVPLLRRELLDNGITLRLELARALPRVLGDRVQLKQVIMNLVINAMQAMAAVDYRARELLIRSRSDGAGQVLLEIQDSGVGIDDESMHRLFNAFFTTKPDGMGMGLSICRSIIESHGGRIWASRNAGPGATFHFSLPVPAETGP